MKQDDKLILIANMKPEVYEAWVKLLEELRDECISVIEGKILPAIEASALNGRLYELRQIKIKLGELHEQNLKQTR